MGKDSLFLGPDSNTLSGEEANVLFNYTEPQKKRRNFNNSIRYGKQGTYFFSLKLQVFIATQGVGTHHKKLSNDKLSLHQNFIITQINNFIA